MFRWLVLCGLLIAPDLYAALRVALILDRGGKDDRSFNAAAYKGALEAKNKLGIELKEIEVTDDSFFEQAMRSFAAKKYDLIICVGVSQGEALKRVAREIPGQKFAIVDAEVSSPNVASLLFEEHEGSYLVGYIAGLKSKSGIVGFIGGMDIPLIRRFELGYKSGALAAKKTIQVLSNFVGVTTEAWNNPTKAKELAKSQFGRSADVIFAAAGASNSGVFDALDNDHFAIGVDSNQNWIKPGRVLTSMLKRVDSSVFEIIQHVSSGKFRAGAHRYGLKNNGIDWAFDEHNRGQFSETETKAIAHLKKKIAAGQISVPDYYRQASK